MTNMFKNHSVVVFVLIVYFVLTLSEASSQQQQHRYYRFWRGIRNPDLSSSEFLDFLNSNFIPQSIKFQRIASGTGDVPFLPLFEQRERNSTNSTLPNETALLQYTDEDAYKNAWSTDIGQEYIRQHHELFKTGKTFSYSLVPQRYSGNVTVQTSYDVLECDSDFTTDDAYFSLYLRNDNNTSNSDLDDMASAMNSMEANFVKMGLKCLLCAVYDDIFMFYETWDDGSRLQHHLAWDGPAGQLIKENLNRNMEEIHHSNYSPHGQVISYGNGVDLPI